jgi:hypothetical protein
MAKKETKFRQEFNVTEDGILGGSNTNKGIMNVEEILSLHVDVVSDEASIIVEARIGKGDWRQIANVPNAENLNYVDMRDYEFIRVKAFNIRKATKIIIFGYDSPVKQDKLEIKFSEKQQDREVVNTELLQNILKQLEIMNVHLSTISDEEI